MLVCTLFVSFVYVKGWQAQEWWRMWARRWARRCHTIDEGKVCPLAVPLHGRGYALLGIEAEGKGCPTDALLHPVTAT
eukprot:10164250-Prorocentrum_lima.AAC.1